MWRSTVIGAGSAFTAFLGLVGLLEGCAFQNGAVALSTPDDESVSASRPQGLSSYTAEYTWQQTRHSQKMLPSRGSVCFLTNVQGKFRGDSEMVKVSNVNGFWWVTGRSHQDGVGASARCFPYDSSKVVATQIGRSSNPGPLDLGDHAFCALSRVSGDFGSQGDEVKVYQASTGHWFLQTSATSSGLNGGAICLDDVPAAPLNVGQALDVIANQTTIIAANLSQGQAQATEPLKGAACFLTRMTGNFSSPGQRVDTHVAGTPGGPWNFYLRAAGEPSIAASAMCLE